MFKSIIVATDDSEHAHKAVELATDIAAKYQARLVLLHVIKDQALSPELQHMAEVEHLIEHRPAAPPAPSTRDVPGQWAASVTQAKEGAAATHRVLEVIGNSVLERAKRAAVENNVNDVSTVIEEGDPADHILACAERENADLIVVGSRGLGNISGMLLGSVSHKVSHLAKCTCITVK